MKHYEVGRIVSVIAMGVMCGVFRAETKAVAGELGDGGLDGSWGLGLAGVGRSAVGNGEAAYALRAVALELEVESFYGAAKILDFDWSHRHAFVEETGGREPWGTLYCMDLGIRRRGSLAGSLIYSVAGGVTTAFEDDPDHSMSAYIGVYGAYPVGQRWTILAGAFYSRHQEVVTDFDFVPVLGLAWNAGRAKGVSISLGLPSTDLTWHFSESTALALLLNYNTMECGIYRLADDNAVRPEGYAALTGADVALRFDTRILDDTDVSLGITRPVHRELELYESDGKNEETYDVEEQLGFTVSISRSF